ncbi:MAG: hypothetical protein HFG73_02530 [Hungatella sp.]|nr:hypothetical protein [Lachnospiraceae bacterium]MCI9147134.1 hypothetical protein [Hungatella sp.]
MRNISNKQPIWLKYHSERDYENVLDALNELNKMQGVSEPLTGVNRRYALGAEQDYPAVSGAFHDGNFDADPADMGGKEEKYGR